MAQNVEIFNYFKRPHRLCGSRVTLPAGMHFSLEFTKESSEYTHGKDKLGTRRTEKKSLDSSRG